MGRFLLFVATMLSPLFSYAQLDCTESTVPSTYSQGVGEWKAYVFQLSPAYNPNEDYSREFSAGSGAARKYRGYLPHGPDFLPTGSLDFDINFGDTGNYATDSTFFRTDKNWKDNSIPGCDTQLQNFGVIFRSRVTIPSGESGIYRFTIGSDDGSRLGLTIREGGEKLWDTIPHNNWGGPKTYNYPENRFNYYIELLEGQEVYLDLSYYEREGSNRISFEMVKYLGPGEIEGSQDLCGIAPDPLGFTSRGPASFLTGTVSYQWQHSLVDDAAPHHWTDIEGATGLTFDESQFHKNGEDQEVHYYRRVAINTADDVVSRVPTDQRLRVTVNYIENLDQEEYGDNRWIGHIYRGKDTINDDLYMGRTLENEVFAQNFNYNNIPSSPVYFTPDYGCTFLTDDFMVRYKMAMSLEPGDYTFKVRGDDGFRLSLNGGASWVINQWSNGTKNTFSTFTLEVEQAATMNLVLEYYEGRIGNFIEFDYEFESLALPLEWGEVKADACGPDNCLTWETIQEKNTSHFELERSYNGLDWELFDSSVQAQGNSTEMHTYKFTDKRVMASKIYYRIKQVDLDEAYEYSEVMRVDNPYFVRSYLPFPNPTVDKIRFFSASEVIAVSLISNDYLLNRGVGLEKLHDNRYEVDLVGLKPGNYVILVETLDGRRDVFKVIKK